MRATVEIDSKWREFERDLDRAIERGLGSTAGTVIAASRGVPTRGYQIGGIVAAASARSSRTPWGIDVEIVWRDFRARFFEFGTYQRRKKKLQRDRRSASAQKGVKQIRFMRAALKVAFPRAVENIRRELR